MISYNFKCEFYYVHIYHCHMTHHETHLAGTARHQKLIVSSMLCSTCLFDAQWVSESAKHKQF